MDHEIPLPPPRRIRHRSPNPPSTQHTLSITNTPRRRHPLPSFPSHSHSHSHSHTRFSDLDRSSQPPSSDPALFSSDDIPASGLENYHAPVAGAGSRKRRYRGTWWGEMVKDKDKDRNSKRKRGEFKEKRLVDSGVWMGSDDSGFLMDAEGDTNWGEELVRRVDGDDDNGAGILGLGMRAQMVQQRQMQMQGQGQVQVQQRAVFRKVEEPREHLIARTVVNDCLEKGKDCVDLSGGNMRTIPPGLLRPLQHLTKLPTIKEPPISEEVYSSLEPFLRLFLAGNALHSITSELFELDTLRVLSLRNNKLTQIPPAIRKLTMLQEVNLSVNRLHHLPWELLFLIKKGDLKHLTVRPNPLLQIEDPGTDIAHWHIPSDELKSCIYDGPAPEEAWAPVHVATGPVTRYNAEGVTLDPTDSVSETRVPSLREVSLLSFSRSSYFDLIPDEEMADYPALMLRLLRAAREVRAAGGRSCSVCHRGFVLARTEWIEWWDCSTYENGLKGPRASGELLRPLPFRRFGCSVGCVPGGI